MLCGGILEKVANLVSQLPLQVFCLDDAKIPGVQDVHRSSSN